MTIERGHPSCTPVAPIAEEITMTKKKSHKTTEEPISSKPISSEPISSKPISSEPISSEPISSEPISSEPISSKPISSEPISSEPISSEPISSKPISSIGLHLNVASPQTKTLANVAENACFGLKDGLPPVLIEGCTGGAYYLRSPSRRITAVFKPLDEEAYAPNNPKNYVASPLGAIGIKHGVLAGESAIRECVAFHLDHGHLAGVPETAMATAFHPGFHFAEPDQKLDENKAKVGSLQEYCQHECSAEDLDSSNFPVKDIHYIGILDIRTCNQDRHPGNILLQYEPSDVVWLSTDDNECNCSRSRTISDGNSRCRSTFRPTCSCKPATSSCNRIDAKVKLIPIDHGCILPHYKALDETSLVWLNWRQSHIPFDSETLEYISHLDSWKEEESIIAMLGTEISNECLLTLHLCTTLLKTCAAKGLTLHTIGKLMCREQIDQECFLELLIQQVKEDYRKKHQFVQEFQNILLMQLPMIHNERLETHRKTSC